MPIIQILWKFKTWIAFAVLFLFWLGQVAYTNKLAGQLHIAEAECTAKVQKMAQDYQKALLEKQHAINKVSADYEQLKSEQRVQVETVTREVQKIVERPVYQQYCLDDDGVSAINSLITSDSS